MQVEADDLPSMIVLGDDCSEYSLDERRGLHGVPSASVAIAKDGEIEWAAGDGDSYQHACTRGAS